MSLADVHRKVFKLPSSVYFQDFFTKRRKKSQKKFERQPALYRAHTLGGGKSQAQLQTCFCFVFSSKKLNLNLLFNMLFWL